MNLQETSLNTSNHKKFSRYLNFCVDFFVMWKNDLVRKISLISKCPTRTFSDLTQVSPLFTTQPKLRSLKLSHVLELAYNDCKNKDIHAH